MEQETNNSKGHRKQVDSVPEVIRQAGNRNPFIAPDGYFETFPERMVAALDASPEAAPRKPIVILRTTKWRAIAASVTILLFAGFTYALITEVILPAIRPETPAQSEKASTGSSDQNRASQDTAPADSSSPQVEVLRHSIISPSQPSAGSLPMSTSRNDHSLQGNKASGTQSNGSSSANLARSTFVQGFDRGGQLLVTGFADTTVCKGAILRYNCGFSPANHDFSWALNDKAIDGNTVSAIQVQTSRLNPGTHRLSLLVMEKGNSRIVHVANAAITVVEAPVIRGDKDLCAYEKAKLTPGPRNPYWEYLWSTGEQTPDITVTRSGKYWLTIRVKGGDCSVTDTFEVRVMPKPLVNLGSDRTICGGDRITLGIKNPSGDFKVRWSPGSNTGNELVFMQEKPGIYKIKVEVTGCSAVTDEIVIHVTDCRLEIPNVFTPNGDGRNDLFLIKGLEQYPGSRLIVTDRNGQVVFETSDYNNDWDGSNQPNGTYFYVLYPGGSQESFRKGSVMILR